MLSSTLEAHTLAEVAQHLAAPKQNKMKISVAQIQPAAGDIQGNISLHKTWIERAIVVLRRSE